jgi:hypothetical protein
MCGLRTRAGGAIGSGVVQGGSGAIRLARPRREDLRGLVEVRFGPLPADVEPRDGFVSIAADATTLRALG